MNRRTFLLRSSAATGALLVGCSAAHDLPGDAGPTHDSSAPDGGPLFPDAPPLRDAAIGGALVIETAFVVFLNDPSCSHHGHTVHVEAGAWDDDAEVSFLGGSHEVRFWVHELLALQAGERLPFATMGNGPGHGHCGTAWRREVGPFDGTLVDHCTPRGTAMCEP
jgi:hypothetical protein